MKNKDHFRICNFGSSLCAWFPINFLSIITLNSLFISLQSLPKISKSENPKTSVVTIRTYHPAAVYSSIVHKSTPVGGHLPTWFRRHLHESMRTNNRGVMARGRFPQVHLSNFFNPHVRLTWHHVVDTCCNRWNATRPTRLSAATKPQHEVKEVDGLSKNQKS